MSKLPEVIFSYPSLNPEKGLEYCGDAEDYIFALETYESSIDTKAKQIEEYLENEDWENYTLNVHSLKSTSSAIGAQGVYEKAMALERAGKSEDYETIRQDNPILLKEYKELKDIISKVLEQYEGD